MSIEFYCNILSSNLHGAQSRKFTVKLMESTAFSNGVYWEVNGIHCAVNGFHIIVNGFH